MHNISNEDLGCFVAHFTNYTRDEEAVDFGYFAFANGIKAGGREFAYVTLDDHATYDGGVFFKITSVQFCGTVKLW